MAQLRISAEVQRYILEKKNGDQIKIVATACDPKDNSSVVAMAIG